MRLSRRNCTARCTRLPSTPKHPGKRVRPSRLRASVEARNCATSKYRAGTLWLSVFDFALAWHRDDTERRDAVALPPQHAEAEAMEGEALAPLGNRAGLVDHKAGNRRCLF